MDEITLIGITIIVITIISVISVLYAIRSAKNKGYKKQIEKLDIEKNKIVSTPIVPELSKIETYRKNEKIETGDKITYIGQGRFGIVHFASPGDTKHFSIKKIIDWEEKDKKPEWRNEMADLYSKIK